MIKLIQQFSRSSNVLKQNTKYLFSSKKEIYDPKKQENLTQHHWHYYDPTHQESEWTHKSNAEQLIHKVPVVYVEADQVRCMGGTQINAGHPQVFIQLNTRNKGSIQTCKYCGIRYAKKDSHSH